MGIYFVTRAREGADTSTVGAIRTLMPPSRVFMLIFKARHRD